jgi:hypothetical protein
MPVSKLALAFAVLSSLVACGGSSSSPSDAGSPDVVPTHALSIVSDESLVLVPGQTAEIVVRLSADTGPVAGGDVAFALIGTPRGA